MNSRIDPIVGVEYFYPQINQDNRGSFTKAYSDLWSETLGERNAEVFYSHSVKGVIRGMHLQVKESSNERIISIISGSVFDVLIDLRPESKTFLNINVCQMSTDSYSTVKVPSGVAHGFQATEPCLTLYVSSTTYNFENDSGVDATSIGVKWPLDANTRSSRDKNLPSLEEWLSIGSR